jgi:hypothetical protein
MSKNAVAALQTPWDCRWSRFGQLKPAEAFWVCAFPAVRIPIGPSDCETCQYWEFLPPIEALAAFHDRAK